MLVKRLLKIGTDYDVKNFHINVEANHVTIDVGFHPFDPAHVRQIIYKLEDKHFITVQELIELEKAGVRRLKDRERFLMRPMRFRRKEYVRRAVFGSNIDF